MRRGGHPFRAPECHPEKKHYSRGLCKQCYFNRPEAKAKNLKRATEYYENNKAKVLRQRKDWALRSKYGITIDDYERKLKQQQGRCAVCAKSAPSERQLAVDHDHETGTVRDLLCTRCNVLLGTVESPELLKSLLQYIHRHGSRMPRLELTEEEAIAA